MIKIKPDALWSAVRDSLRQDIPATIYDLWIPGIRFGAISEDTVTVEVADSIHQNYVEEAIMVPLCNRLEKATGQRWKVELTVNSEVGKLHQGELFEPLVAVAAEAPTKKAVSKTGLTKLTIGAVKEGQDFANYIVGPSNHIAVAAAKRVSTLPVGDKGVVLIYGGTGLGKTHLLQATALECLQRSPKAKIALIGTIEWVDEFIDALGKGRITQFREKYRSLDLLLVDDVQNLANKERSQDEFFQIYNWLQDRGKKMVFTCDKPPQDVVGLEERLVSRFGWGLSSYLSTPDFEMRAAILRKEIDKLARNVAQEFTHEVVELVAHRVTRNVRRLESSVMQIAMWISLHPGRVITPELVQEEILRDTFASEAKEQVSPEKIAKVVGSILRVKEQDLRGPKRTAALAWARQLAMYVCRSNTDMTLQEISNFFGKKDHGTVMHAVKKVEAELEKNPKADETLRLVLRQLQA